MPSPDTITAIAAVAFMALLILSMRLVRPPGSARPRHGAAWLDAHDVPANMRGLATDEQADPDEQPTWVIAPVEIPAISLSALETVPDPVSPFAARAAL